METKKWRAKSRETGIVEGDAVVWFASLIFSSSVDVRADPLGSGNLIHSEWD